MVMRDRDNVAEETDQPFVRIHTNLYFFQAHVLEKLSKIFHLE